MASPRRRSGSPKISEAIALLKSAPNQIEAGILKEYPGRRIAEFWRTIGPRRTGEMTPRELCVIVEGLSDSSWYARTKRHAWSLLEELVASTGNALRALREDYRNAHGAELEWEPVTAPELVHERIAREERERREAAERKYHNALRGNVMELMLSGRLKLADIDMSRSIEETLAAVA